VVFEQVLRHHAARREKRARRVREQNAAKAQARARRARVRARWEAAAVDACADYTQHCDLIPTVQIDSPVVRLTNLPKRRIRAYQQHLYAVISAAFGSERRDANPGAPAARSMRTADEADSESINGRLCAVCEGRCCSSGGDRAYINAGTIRKIRSTCPGIRPQAVFNRYMDALANRTVERSCINHTASGCGLSRDLRSDTCNTFFCDPMREFDAACSGLTGPAAGALLISHKHARENPVSGPFTTTVYLVEPDATRELLPPAKGDDA
jgi:hypothetical protein